MDAYGLPILQMIGGLVGLYFGGEWLVAGAVRLAAVAKISPLVIGLTVVAFGTSSPELAVSVNAAFIGQADIAVGNVVGSNIFNVLFILGLSALIAPLLVSSQLIRLDVPLMIAASVALYLIALDGNVNRIEGSFFFLALVIYTVWLIRKSRKESAVVQEEFAQEFSEANTAGTGSLWSAIGLALGGIILLTIGARFMVDGSIAIARLLGVSELIIGLTIIAAGTSLPEVAASVLASVRGERDIAVGNVVGSNIFNIFCVLGLSAVISPTPIAVSETAMRFDIPVMIAVAAACLPIFFTGHIIDRWEGLVFFAYYVAYLVYLILAETKHSLAPSFEWLMMMVVLPTTVITLVAIGLHSWWRPTAAGEQS